MQLISRNLSMYQLAHKPLPGSSSKRRPQHYLVVHRAPLKPSQTIALHVNMRNKQSVKHFISLASVRKLAAPTAGLKFLRYHNGKLTMSGRRRHVHLGLRESVEAPKEGQSIVRVVNARGGNIVEVEYPDGRQTLCMMPNKFNKMLWVKRGGFVLIDNGQTGSDAPSNVKITGTIIAVLYTEQIRDLKKIPGVWPEAFNTEQEKAVNALEDMMPPSEDSEIEGEEAEAQQKASEAGKSGGETTCKVEGQQGDGQQEEEEEEEEDDSLPPLQANTNRKVIVHYVSDDEDDEDDD